MDVGAFLEPIEEDAPSGENLEYEMVFTDMELAAQYGEERQVGDSVLEAEEPDFGDLAGKARAVLSRSHDIRAAVFLAEAVLHTDGLPAFAEAVGLVRGFLEGYWDSCHPQLDEDDGDATMRINAAQGLADAQRMIRSLRRAGLTESRAFGRISLREVEIADGRAEPPPGFDGVTDAAAVSAAFQDTGDDTLTEAAAAVRAAREHVAAIEAVFAEKTPGEAPQLDRLSDTLKAIEATYARFGAGGGAAEAAEPEPAGGGGPAPAAPAATGGGQGAPGAIRGPDDVVRALDAIMNYYARSEPSSPVPVLLARARRLVSADFLTIVRDMAPDGMDDVRRIGGLKDEDDDD